MNSCVQTIRDMSYMLFILLPILYQDVLFILINKVTNKKNCHKFVFMTCYNTCFACHTILDGCYLAIGGECVIDPVVFLNTVFKCLIVILARLVFTVAVSCFFVVRRNKICGINIEYELDAVGKVWCVSAKHIMHQDCHRVKNLRILLF